MSIGRLFDKNQPDPIIELVHCQISFTWNHSLTGQKKHQNYDEKH